MSTFDISQDAPGLLRAEALNITISFTRTGPVTGRVSWNIPPPAAGCASGSQAYGGMVVTLDTTASTHNKSPKDGTIYTADATAAVNLFAGDKIASSLVVGAFYDTTTTFFDITGLQPDTPYYITGFPVDAQFRYYKEGVHAFSLNLTNRGTEDTCGSQIAVLNPDQQRMGVQPTDSTGLQPALTYSFKVRVGLIPPPLRPLQSTDCILAPPTYTIVVAGSNALDYQSLVVEINKQLALATNNTQGPNPPNAGAYYLDTATNQLFVWNGYVNTLVPGVIIQNTAPNIVVVGTYWYDPITNVLAVWSGVSWTPITVIRFNIDPTVPQADTTYWYDTTNQHGYVWNGVTWCDTFTYVQDTDPSIAIVPPAGSYWVNSSTNVIYRWNESLGMWVVVTAVEYLNDPNALTQNDYWFNTTNNVLYRYDNPILNAWNAQSNVVITEIAPITALPAVIVPGTYWYNPISTVLQQWNGTIWITLNVITFAVDPTVRSSCGLWYNTATHVLNVWDSINNIWVVAPSVYVQGVDPTTPPTILDGTLWYNTSNNTLNVWLNNCFINTPFISWPSNPIGLPNGVSWFNTTTKLWYIRQGGVWVQIMPVNTSQAPNSLTAGTFWLSTSPTVNLQQWNGVVWVTVVYSTAPYAPLKGSTWFNTTTNTLMEWNGTMWVLGTPVATCQLDCNGNLLFTDTHPGSLSFIKLTDVTMFQSLAVRYIFHDETPGSDGVSDRASYEEIGIGTDGTADERLKLHTEVQYELGYPVVDVEITPQQLDYAISKALGEFRSRASLAYKRGYFFMGIPAEHQNFVLSNKVSGMNKIVDVIGVYRLTSSFLSSAHGAGVYGQIVLQHLYNMGTFDLLSYHIMAEYTKLMEILFAARVAFTWNEQTRTLHLQNRFPFNERMICIEATTERTEQDLLTDRYTRPWMRRYTVATICLILSNIRGKYATLPGAGGQVTLNGAELRQHALTEIENCLMEIEQYVVDKPEEYGKMDFTFG